MGIGRNHDLPESGAVPGRRRGNGAGHAAAKALTQNRLPYAAGLHLRLEIGRAIVHQRGEDTKRFLRQAQAAQLDFAADNANRPY